MDRGRSILSTITDSASIRQRFSIRLAVNGEDQLESQKLKAVNINNILMRVTEVCEYSGMPSPMAMNFDPYDTDKLE